MSQGSSEEWGDLLENCNDLVQSISPEGRFLYVNRGWLETLGYAREEVEGLALLDTVDPGCQAHCREVLERVMSGEVIDSIETTFLSKSGEQIAVEGSINCRFEDGRPRATRGIFRDVRERRLSREALAQSELRLRTIMDSMQDGLVVIDAETHLIVEANRVALELFGGPEDELLGHTCFGLICPLAEGHCPVTDEGHEVRRQEQQFCTAAGASLPVIKTVVAVELGGREHLVESFVDISERKAMEERLRFLSWHDPLTGLCNRRRFEEELRRLQEQDAEDLGLIVCDVDDLKVVNDVHGHEVGDETLVGAAALLSSCVRAGDMVARIGGDEFALILPEADALVLDSLRRRVCEAVEAHNALGDSRLSLSLGCALLGRQGSWNELFRAADADMYERKQLRRRRQRGGQAPFPA